MSTDVAKRIDRQSVVRGVWVGLFLLAVGYFGYGLIPLPREVWWWLQQTGLIGLILPGLVVWPTLVLLVATVVAAMRRRDASYWIAMALGAAAAAIAVVVSLLAAMGVIALFVV